MEQALERVSKSVENYSAGTLTKGVAMIELVSAFKVACKNTQYEAADLQSTVQRYIDSVLRSIDDGRLQSDQAVLEIRRVYEAAHSNDPAVVAYMARFT